MKSSLFVLAAVVLCCTSLFAQAPGESISLDVVVQEKSKQEGAPLGPADFSLFDNQKRVPITSVKLIADTEPVEVLLVVDAINVPHESIAYERQQIDDYLSANEGKLPQPVRMAIVTDTGVQTQRSATRDGLALKKTFDSLTVPLRVLHQNAALPGAIERAEVSLKILHQLIVLEQKQPGRKLMLWISPGWPLISGPGLDISLDERRRIFHEVVQFSAELRASRITVYQLSPIPENVAQLNYWRAFAKGISKASQAEEADLSLQVLAEHCGGEVLNESNAIAAFIRRVVEDSRFAYRISFPASKAEHADEYHKVEVVLDRPGLTARTTQSYYAQP